MVLQADNNGAHAPYAPLESVIRLFHCPANVRNGDSLYGWSA